MNNTKLLLEALERDLARDGDAVPPVPGRARMGAGGDALEGDPAFAPMIVALVIVASALSGFVVGYLLGPLAFWVMR